MSAEERGRALFEERFSEIERAVRSVARRNRLSMEDGKELYSLTMLKLVRREFAVLRAYAGRSGWGTYLSSVAQRVWLDHRNRELGKWRPCAQSRRLGPVAVQLDRYINRDGLTHKEGVEKLLARGVGDRARLRALARRIPRRPKRRSVPLQEWAPRASRFPSSSPWERKQLTARLRMALRSALRDLSEQERRLLWLRFGRSWTVRRIAEELEIDPRTLYRKFQNIFCRLRKGLEDADFRWKDIRPDWDASALELKTELFGDGQGRSQVYSAKRETDPPELEISLPQAKGTD